MKPLHVDFLPDKLLPAGRLGLTFAPGSSTSSDSSRLTADLERLAQHYEADTLVSLLEPAEYALLGVPELLSEAAAHGLNVLHCPIPDFGVPPGTLEDFRSFVQGLLNRLQAGETVIVHCRAGKGRSGLLAAAVLGVSGRQAVDAINAVRAARPGAIETAEQEKFLQELLTQPG